MKSDYDESFKIAINDSFDLFMDFMKDFVSKDKVIDEIQQIIFDHYDLDEYVKKDLLQLCKRIQNSKL